MLYNISMIETKRKSLILNIVLTTIILVIGFLFWPGKEKFNQSNPRDVNKTQIKIKVKALNIRKEATVESKDIGTVYEGEIFTVLERIDNEDYYWYKIKTKQGTKGYLASDRNSEYVEVISGLVDRVAPEINTVKDFLIFVDGKENYEDVTCKDNYSECTLTYEILDDKTIKITGKDKDENTSVKEINYYKVYNISTLYSDITDNIRFTIIENNEDNTYTLWTNYIANKEVLSANKSSKYAPVIEFFDEDFNRIDKVSVAVNKEILQGSCINDKNNNLKSIYLDKDLKEGSMLCMNYMFNNSDNNIKYFSLGFFGIDNSDNENNSFSNYKSDYFILK